MGTIRFIWGIALTICGGLLTIMNLLEKIGKAKKAIDAPNEEQNRRIRDLEKKCEKYDGYFHSDKQRIADLEQSLSILMQCDFALLSHAINGNDTDKLKNVQSSMMNYLTQRGITV